MTKLDFMKRLNYLMAQLMGDVITFKEFVASLGVLVEDYTREGVD